MDQAIYIKNLKNLFLLIIIMISELPVTRSEGCQFPSCQLRVQKVKVADLEPEATISGKEKKWSQGQVKIFSSFLSGIIPL